MPSSLLIFSRRLKIQIHVEVPTDMNDEQKKAMEDFLAATGEEKRPWA